VQDRLARGGAGRRLGAREAERRQGGDGFPRRVERRAEVERQEPAGLARQRRERPRTLAQEAERAEPRRLLRQERLLRRP